MSFTQIPIGSKAPDEFNVVIEIPKGTKNKYEYSEQLDAIVLDRVVHSSVVYPLNYGFIPETRAEDGDHLDALVLGHDAVFPGCVVTVRPVGMLKMTDDKGMDWKILCALSSDPKADHIRDITDINQAFLDEIRHFFEIYKQLEGKTVSVEGFSSAQEAKEAISSRIEKQKK